MFIYTKMFDSIFEKRAIDFLSFAYNSIQLSF